MGFRFRRSVKILPGVRLNFGKKGTSVTVGPRGAKVTVGPNGTRATVGIPGTGISYTEKLDGPKKTPTPAKAESSAPVDTSAGVDAEGNLYWKVCPHCGHRMRKKWDACPACGGELPARVRCPGCGAIFGKDYVNFCPLCGRRMHQTIARHPDAPTGPADAAMQAEMAEKHMVQCPKCWMIFPENVKYCPACGRRNRPEINKKEILAQILWTVFGIIFVAVMGASCMHEISKENAPTTPPAAESAAASTSGAPSESLLHEVTK